METVKKNKLFWETAICCSLLAFNAGAKEIDMNMAQMQAMDKITGKVSLIEVPVNGSVKFGSFSIVVRACKSRPPEETPENFAFVDVVDDYSGTKPFNIFRGWMMSSTPALNPVEHPIYDVWLLKCLNGKVDKSKLLSAEALKERDTIEKAPKVEALKTKPLNKSDENAEKDSLAENSENSLKNLPDVVDKRKLETLAISDPEPLIESEKNNIQEEDGAPKSLLNIDSFTPGQSSQEEKEPSTSSEDEQTIFMVEEVVIGQEVEGADGNDTPKSLLPVSLDNTDKDQMTEEVESQSILFEEKED